jgi:GT2 family glycosyltransferase
VQYDEGYQGNAYREETDFYLRAGKYGHKIYYCPHTLCFHLPREVNNLGGCMSQGIWAHKYWGLRNNYRFLKNNHAYLRQKELVDHGPSVLMLYFAINELPKIATFYMRKYYPEFYAMVGKRLLKSRL